MKKQKPKQQKLSYISLGIIAVAMIGMVLPSLLPVNAQNTTTDSIEVESVEDQLDIADDLIEAKLGQN